MSRAEAVIDLEAVRSNLATIGAAVGVTPIMAVVKADGYGHGMAQVARAARSVEVQWLGVALPAEARALRESGDAGRILAWLWAPGDPDVDFCTASGVDLSISSQWALAEVAASARRAGTRARVHLKIDTGLSRNGAGADEWAALVAAAHAEQDGGAIEVVAVWSHLANADRPDDPSVADARRAFDAACDVAGEILRAPVTRHLANTAAALGYPETRYDLVRVGIGMYGVAPAAPGSAAELGLTGAMSVRARLALVKRIPAGQAVSYGSTWQAVAPTRVGLVPLGYADGIPRSASGRAEVLVAGARCPVLGRIAMDQFVIGLDNELGDVRAGDEVAVFADAASGAPTADDWAIASGSIGYEIVTRVGSRVPRRYLGAR